MVEAWSPCYPKDVHLGLSQLTGMTAPPGNRICEINLMAISGSIKDPPICSRNDLLTATVAAPVLSFPRARWL